MPLIIDDAWMTEFRTATVEFDEPLDHLWVHEGRQAQFETSVSQHA